MFIFIDIFFILEFFMLCNKKYKIGRSNPNNQVDVPIEEDLSVSRLHAELLLKYEEKQCVWPT